MLHPSAEDIDDGGDDDEDDISWQVKLRPVEIVYYIPEEGGGERMKPTAVSSVSKRHDAV